MMTLNHGLSGYIVGQLAKPLLRRAPVRPGALSAAFFAGAMAPDADVVARVLGGRGAYLGDAWYGHRAASHSIAGTLVLGLAVAGLLYALQRRRPPSAGYLWIAACGWAGGLLHIIGDLFTPRSPMPVFWPISDGRFGAWSHIGWFSPYLLWLFLATIAVGWAGAALLPRRAALRPAAPLMIWSLYALATYRWVQFLLVSRYESGEQWHAYQQALLPDALVTPLSAAVSALWFWISS